MIVSPRGLVKKMFTVPTISPSGVKSISTGLSPQPSACQRMSAPSGRHDQMPEARPGVDERAIALPDLVALAAMAPVEPAIRDAGTGRAHRLHCR